MYGAFGRYCHFISWYSILNKKSRTQYLFNMRFILVISYKSRNIATNIILVQGQLKKIYLCFRARVLWVGSAGRDCIRALESLWPCDRNHRLWFCNFRMFLELLSFRNRHPSWIAYLFRREISSFDLMMPGRRDTRACNAPIENLLNEYWREVPSPG